MAHLARLPQHLLGVGVQLLLGAGAQLLLDDAALLLPAPLLEEANVATAVAAGVAKKDGVGKARTIAKEIVTDSGALPWKTAGRSSCERVSECRDVFLVVQGSI